MRNAYNSVRRDLMLEALFNEPDLAPLWRIAEWAYSEPSELYIRGDVGIASVLQSESGTRQGYVFSMLLFCLAIKAPLAAALGAGGIPL